jgi:DNA-binding NtrC family response regulator
VAHEIAGLIAGGDAGRALAAKALRKALRQHRGNVRATAEALGTSEPTLHRWIAALDIGEHTQGREANARAVAAAKKKRDTP